MTIRERNSAWSYRFPRGKVGAEPAKPFYKRHPFITGGIALAGGWFLWMLWTSNSPAQTARYQQRLKERIA